MIVHSNVTLTSVGTPLHLIEICNATLLQFTRATRKQQAKDNIIATISAVIERGLGFGVDSHEKIH
jgi:hypothetical protein